MPLGIGEVLRQAIGKTINWVLKDDIQEAAASIQTATGLKAGSEAKRTQSEPSPKIHQLKVSY